MLLLKRQTSRNKRLVLPKFMFWKLIPKKFHGIKRSHSWRSFIFSNLFCFVSAINIKDKHLTLPSSWPLTALLQYKTFDPPVTCSQSFFPVPPTLLSLSLGTLRIWLWAMLAGDGLLVRWWQLSSAHSRHAHAGFPQASSDGKEGPYKDLLRTSKGFTRTCSHYHPNLTTTHTTILT